MPLGVFEPGVFINTWKWDLSCEENDHNIIEVETINSFKTYENKK